MLRTQSEPTIVSKEEQDVLNLENRRNTAESGSLAASEAKRKIEADIKKIEDDVEVGKQTIEKNNNEIISINEKILEVQNFFRNEKQSLEEFIKLNQSKKSELEVIVDKKQTELYGINSEIISLSKKIELDRFNSSQELKEIKIEQSTILNEISKLEYNKGLLIKELDSLIKGISNFKEDIKKISEEKNTVESFLTSCKNEVENQKGIIENNKIIINQQEDKKNKNQLELSSWIEKIFKKEEEYKSIEMKAFTILNKQQILDNKTTFIKGQYERAGIKWEE